MRLRSLAVLLLLIQLGFSQTYIHDVRIVDPATGTVLPEQTVFIPINVRKGTKPLAVLKGLTLEGQRGLRKSKGSHVEGRGKFLMPGLWDMHVHVAGISAKPEWSRELLSLYLVQGITSVRDMGGDWKALQELRARTNSPFRSRHSQRRLPYLYVAGPFLDADAKGFSNANEVIAVTTPEEARAAVAKLVAEGVDFIKTGSRLSAESFRAVAAECKRTGLPFGGHVPDAVTVEEASDLGMRTMEHLFGMQLAMTGREAEFRQRAAELRAKQDREGLARLNEEIDRSFDPRAAAALFAKLKKNGTYIVPTLVWTKIAHQLAEVKADDPRLAHIPKQLREEWAPEKAAKLFSPRGVDHYRKKFAHDMKVVKMMSDAGVKLIAGSDSLDPYVFPGDSLHEELALMVEAGLTPAQALRTATTIPRELVGGEAQPYGWIVLDANPLEDIRNTRSVHAVIKGETLRREDLDNMKAAVEKAFQ